MIKGLGIKGYIRTRKECESLMKQLNDAYKQCVDNNSGSGNPPMTFQYFEVIYL